MSSLYNTPPPQLPTTTKKPCSRFYNFADVFEEKITSATAAGECRSESTTTRHVCATNGDKTKVRFGAELGSGAFGTVKKAQLFIPDGSGFRTQHVAAKEVKLLDDSAEYTVSEEFHTQYILTHKAFSSAECGLLVMIGVYMEYLEWDENKKSYPCKCWAIMPECEATLFTLLNPIKQKKINNPELFYRVVVNFLQGSLRGLQTLSAQDFTHGDLKPKNVFFKGGFFGFLDFGTAKSNTALTSETTLQGTPGYLAPEVIVDSRVMSSASDVFAVGQMLRELLEMKSAVVCGDDAINYVYESGRAFQLARKSLPIDPAPEKQAAIETEHQTNILAGFRDCDHTPQARLKYMAMMMTQILPECRPNLKTLGDMLTQVKIILPSVTDDEMADCNIDLVVSTCSMSGRVAQKNTSLSTFFSDVPKKISSGNLNSSQPAAPASTPPDNQPSFLVQTTPGKKSQPPHTPRTDPSRPQPLQISPGPLKQRYLDDEEGTGVSEITNIINAAKPFMASVKGRGSAAM